MENAEKNNCQHSREIMFSRKFVLMIVSVSHFSGSSYFIVSRAFTVRIVTVSSSGNYLGCGFIEPPHIFI